MIKPKQKDIPDYEEEKKMDEIDESGNCPYCRQKITNKDESMNNVEMFVETECYHRFHKSCFKEYAKK